VDSFKQALKNLQDQVHFSLLGSGGN